MKELKALHKLSAISLGGNYHSLYHCALFLKHPRYATYTFYEGKKMLGFITLFYPNSKEFLKKSKGKLKVNTKLMVLDTIVVHPDFQKKGIGKKLMNKALKNFEKHKIICPAWHSKNGTHLKQLLIKSGFKKITTSYLHYFNESIRYNYSCAICGKPCKCAVEFYVLNAGLQ